MARYTCVNVVSYKNCFKIARASRAIPGLSRKKLKQKDHFQFQFQFKVKYPKD